jgi:hypothetical protein
MSPDESNSQRTVALVAPTRVVTSAVVSSTWRQSSSRFEAIACGAQTSSAKYRIASPTASSCPGLCSERDTEQREPQPAATVAKFIDDREREPPDHRKSCTPGEGNAIDGEVFGRLEAHPTRPRLLPHLAGLPDTDNRRDLSVARERAANIAPNEFR